ncbi:hypothetical protein BDR07DRAFT_1487975 [Suillus spraguei]|nr:hypothetical protein BDR07DRAFT_1487975 [Suillus spraguei]
MSKAAAFLRTLTPTTQRIIGKLIGEDADQTEPPQPPAGPFYAEDAKIINSANTILAQGTEDLFEILNLAKAKVHIPLTLLTDTALWKMHEDPTRFFNSSVFLDKGAYKERWSEVKIDLRMECDHSYNGGGGSIPTHPAGMTVLLGQARRTTESPFGEAKERHHPTTSFALSVVGQDTSPADVLTRRQSREQHLSVWPKITKSSSRPLRKSYVYPTTSAVVPPVMDPKSSTYAPNAEMHHTELPPNPANDVFGHIITLYIADAYDSLLSKLGLTEKYTDLILTCVTVFQSGTCPSHAVIYAQKSQVCN